MLLGAAQNALDGLDEAKPGWFYGSLTAMTTSALAIEALANAFGERLVEGWEDFERSSPTAKLRLVCRELKIKLSFDQEPWSSVKWLLKFRNQIAHAKPKLITTSHLWTEEEYEAHRFDQPKSDLEGEITVKNAKRAYHAADSLKELWCSSIPPDEAEGLYGDSWSGSAGIEHEP
jgi:hypothetical protein